jgi:hypothetical protein
MPSPRSSLKADLLFVVPVATAFCIALSLLVTAETMRLSVQGRERIGYVTYKNRVAERKMSAQAMWASLSQNAPLYSGDTIHTSAGSSAVLHLDSRADVSLGEETLVRIDSTSRKTELRLDSGFIAVKREPSARQLGISSGGDAVELRDGGLSARRSGEELALSVEGGTASLTTSSGTREVASGDSLVVRGSAAMDVPAKLLEPPIGGTLYQAQGEATVFRWSAPAPPAGGRARQALLIVAEDSAFSRVEAELEAKADRTALILGAGTHYWKLVASTQEDGRRSESAVGWFNAVGQESPDPIEPRGRTFSYAQSLPIVPFSWSSVPNASAYRLELVDRGSGKTLLTKLVSGTSLAVDSLGKGEYRWKVGALLGPEGREFYGDSADFSVLSRPAAAPKLRIRASSTAAVGATAVASSSSVGTAPRISAEALKRGATIAAWDEVPEADYYEARISSDSEDRAVLARSRTDTNVMKEPLALAPGDYYLQVRSVAGETKSEYSAAMAFTVTAAEAPVALAPAEGFEADPTNRRLRFRWEADEGSGPVRLQLSDESGFSRPWEDTEASASSLDYGIPADRSGRIYWRVSVKVGGEVVSSAPRSFRMPVLLAVPRIVAPAEGEVLDVNATRQIRLAWEASPGANVYSVKAFMLYGGRSSLVQSWETSDNHVSIGQFAPYSVGNLAWTVVARETDGGATLARSPEEKAFFALSQSRPLPAPIVHFPVLGGD